MAGSMFRRHARTLWADALASVAILLVSGAPSAAEPSVSVLPLGFEATELRGPASRLAQVLSTSDALRGARLSADQPLVAIWGKAGGVAMTLAGKDLRALPLGTSAADAAGRELARGAIPQSRLQAAGPLTVFLSEPTQDYRHGVLGDAIEAKSLTIAERQPVPLSGEAKPVPTKVTAVAAGPDAVFEDLEPRLADLDRDGTPEIIVVRSYFERGSALAVVGKKDGAWAVIAETPPVGQPHRWLTRPRSPISTATATSTSRS